MSKIKVARSIHPAILDLLARHPDVEEALFGGGLLQFEQDGQLREVFQGAVDCPVFGVVELMDNNPLVCAQSASLPDPASTLAMLAVGPLVDAGLLNGPTTIECSIRGVEAVIQANIARLGPADHIRVTTRSAGSSPDFEVELLSDFGLQVSLEAPAVLLAKAHVGELASLDELSDLYDERYSKSFFMRRKLSLGQDSIGQILGTGVALYSLEYSGDASSAEVMIKVAADPNGKPFAAGLVHMMNVMAGFEESLGLSS